MKTMSMTEEIKSLWQIYDEGYTNSNDLILAEKLLYLVNLSDTISSRDKEMYARFATCTMNGGFLVREEKKFLINYLILLIDHSESCSEQMRDSHSILDVWPQQQGLKNNRDSANYRNEFLLWFIRMYEALGNIFLQKRQYTTGYWGFELARTLEIEKCKMKEDEYTSLELFLCNAEVCITHGVELSSDYEQGVNTMRKLIWKIKQGIVKYP